MQWLWSSHKPPYVPQGPIDEGLPAVKAQLAEKAKAILALKGSDPAVGRSVLEGEVDELVCGLYGEEIGLVGG